MGFLDEFNAITEMITVCELEFGKEFIRASSALRPFCALSIRMIGDATITNGDFSFELKSGDILFVPEGMDYDRICHSPEKIIVVHFCTNVKFDHSEYFTPENPQLFFEHFEKLNRIWIQRKEGYMYEAAACLNLILRDIVIQKRAVEIKTNTPEYMLNPATRYIEENFEKTSFTVEDLAQMCHMSSAYFRRLFRKIYKTSPLDYINGMRIKYARELLETGYYSVKEVADKCGIPNSKYFATIYKKKTGYSPSEVGKRELERFW